MIIYVFFFPSIKIKLSYINPLKNTFNKFRKNLTFCRKRNTFSTIEYVKKKFFNAEFLIQQFFAKKKLEILKLNNGRFSNKIYGIFLVENLKRCKMIIKTSKLPKSNINDNDNEDYLKNFSVQKLVYWNRKMLSNCSPYQEALNLNVLANYTPLLIWNAKNFTNYNLKIPIVEKILYPYDTNLYEVSPIIFIHGAYGCCLNVFLLKPMYYTMRYINNLMYNFGRMLANFHYTTKLSHLDLHIGNVFWSPHKKTFCLIDAHSMAHSIRFSNLSCFCNTLHAFDREFFILSVLMYIIKRRKIELANLTNYQFNKYVDDLNLYYHLGYYLETLLANKQNCYFDLVLNTNYFSF